MSFLRPVPSTALANRGSSNALTVVRLMIEIPDNASVNSGMIGPHISGEVAVTTIGKPSTLAAFANATTLCFNSATGMSLTPVNSPTWWSMRSNAAFSDVSRSVYLLFSILLFCLLFFLFEVAERSSRSHHILNLDKTEIPCCLARHTDLIYWNMDLKLTDKTALVSGSTKGIGFAIATGLAGEGARVIVNGRSEKAVAEAKQQIVQTQPDAKIESFAGDLSTAAATETLLQRFPFVDILVNNLGIFEPSPFENISDEDWRRFFEVNVLGGVRLSRAYLPGMRQRNWGRIVFISSESAINTPAEMIHYGMTKTAQLAVSRGLAQSRAGTAVTVNAVLPGPTHSAGVEEFAGQLSGGKPFAEFEQEFFKTVRPSSLLKRFAMPEEVADLVTYVCSPLSVATNGAALRVDGGVVQACF